MIDDKAFIVGLMRHFTNELGFIPQTTIENRYLPRNLYVIQRNTKGVRVGYILHGVPRSNRVLTIAQAVIDFDYQQQGFARQAFAEVKLRAEQAGCREIVLRCADDLTAANLFWLTMGFDLLKTECVSNTRKRKINTYGLSLQKRLF